MNEQNQKSPTENNKKHNGRRLVAGLLLAGVATGGIGEANHKVESTPANTTSSRSIPVTANMPSYREVNQITLEPTQEETIQEDINTADTNNSVVLEVQEGSSQEVDEQTPNN